MLYLFLLANFIISINAIAETYCKTPFGEKGICRSLASCESLLSSFSNPKYDMEEHLNTFLCSNNTAKGVYVCCPISTHTLRFEDEENTWDPDAIYVMKELVNDDNCGIQDGYVHGDGEIALYKFPWLVKIVAKTNSLDNQGVIHKVACTGILITQHHVLYTMQCHYILVEEELNVYVRVDSYTGNDPECNAVNLSYSKNCSTYETYEVEHFFRHPYYDPVTKINDVAIIRLDRHVAFSEFVKAICLPLVSDIPKYGMMYVSGWSRTFLSTDSIMKRTYTSVAIPNSSCNGTQNINDTLTKFDMCTAQGTLPKDELIGYPVTVLHKNRWYITGLTSRGTEPRIHVRIQNYLQYIKEALEGETCETPFGQRGRCKPLASCNSLLWSFSNPKCDMEEHLDKFLCSNNTDKGVYVCCGISTDTLLFEDEEDTLDPDAIYILKQLVNDESCGVQQSGVPNDGVIGLHNFPWLVKIVVKNNSLDEQDIIHKVACTGVIISQRYVLYTMQCHYILVNEGPNVYIRVDSYTGNNLECNTVASSYSKYCSTYDTYEVEHFFLHPYYDSITKINDLAIIRVERRIEFSEFLKPICLPLQSDLPYSGMMYVSGWNRTFLPTEFAMKSTYTSIAIPNSDCRETYKFNDVLTTFDMCTVQGTLPEVEPIGYPVTILHKNQWYLTGFTSRGKEPQIHIRIQNYLQYIKETMGGEQCLTPFNETGECILLTECPRLRGAFANVNGQEINLLEEFVCEYPAEVYLDKEPTLKVCCGYSSNFTVFQNETIEMPSTYNISNYGYCGLQHRDDYFSTNDQLAIDEFPWLAAIINATLPHQRDAICGGSLITNRYVLTSTQCIDWFNKSDSMLVRLGDYNLKNDDDCLEISELHLFDCTDVQEYEVERRIKHPYYNQFQFINDIGLLRLKNIVEFSDYVRPICLPKSEEDYLSYGETFYATGFGDNDRNVQRTKIKKKIPTTLISPDDCKRKYSLLLLANPKTDYEFCTEDFKNFTDTVCIGDEGGPVMYSKRSQWYIQGISSSYGCSDAEPQTYLKVFKYLRWIYYKINV